jgi:hypothetical protein
MTKKDIVLIAAAVGAAMQAASIKATNPNLVVWFSLLGVGLSWWADHPRDPTSRDRADDEADTEREDGPSADDLP